MTLAVVGIGMPGSGKTSLLEPFAQRRELVYINRDSIREALTGDAANRTRNTEVECIANQQAVDSLHRKHGVVLDSTFCDVDKRRAIIGLLREAGATHIIGCRFDIPLATALMRNRGRDRVVDEMVIREMHAQLERSPPAKQDGFDELIVHTALESIKVTGR